MLHKFNIRNKVPGTTLTGANCEVLIDGEPLKGCSKLELSVQAGGVAELKLTMLVDLDSEFTLSGFDKVILQPLPGSK